MISAFSNTFKVPELRNRVLFTIIMLVIIRIGAAIPCPGINVSVLQEWLRTAASSDSGGVAALFNLFSGGAIENCAIFSLGVMPYISAQIMFQMFVALVPSLSKLSREDNGRQKIAQYTRYATIALCVLQGALLARTFEHPENNIFLPHIAETIQKMGVSLVAHPGIGFELICVLALTAGSMFLMWIGDQITDSGIGNGVSLIITIGIVARLPAALIQVWNTFVPNGAKSGQMNPMLLVLLVLFLVIVIGATIAITQAQRKVSVQYAKRVVGRKVYGGQTQYMPLKVNYSGVMPIIFANALLIFPSTILTTAFHAEWAQRLAQALTSGWVYVVFYGAMIFFFSYFWVAMQFQPAQIADDLKKSGGYIPGYRPGKPTADFLDFTMTRLTFAGAIFLTIIAVLPQMLAHYLNVPSTAAQFFGGTGLLIIVGVLLDTMRQVETYLIQRHYDGFLRKGKLRGRFENAATGRGETAKQGALVMALAFVGLLAVCGVAAWLGHWR